MNVSPPCITVTRMRSVVLVTLALALSLTAGCRRGDGVSRPTPSDPTRLDACPAGPHLLMGLFLRTSSAEPALLRFDAALQPCQGLSLPDEEWGTLETVGGLRDGRDLVGFSTTRGGSVVIFDGTAEAGRVESDEYRPISVTEVPLEGGALAVLWGSLSSSSRSGEQLNLYRLSDLSLIGSFDADWEDKAVTPAPSGQASRFATLRSPDGLQEYRLDPGATEPSTTGELQIALPRGGTANAIDLVGGEPGAGIVVAQDDGISWWSPELPRAFLGPTHCQWPAFAGTPLPANDADYASVAADGDAALALVDGELEGGSEEQYHLYRMTRRGECELLYSIPDTHRAVALAWSGR